MDGLRLAGLSVWTSLKFLFWTAVELVSRKVVEALHFVNAHKEASRELLVLKPRRPKDLYDNGYVLFAYDIACDAWRGYWRKPDAVHGEAAAELYEIKTPQWANVPHHEVDFSDMPEISFHVRAVSLAWCRKEMPEKPLVVQPEARVPPLPMMPEPEAATQH